MAKPIKDVVQDIEMLGPGNTGIVPPALQHAAEAETDWSQYAGAGMEEVKATDLKMPIWRILQSGSPEQKKSALEYIQGAEEGHWFDTISKQIYVSINFVPCKFQTHWIEWKPDQGGLVADHGASPEIMAHCKRDPEDTFKITTPGGNDLIETAMWFGIVIGGCKPPVGNAAPEEVHFLQPGLIPLSKTAMKVSKAWMSQARNIRDPFPNAPGSYIAPLFSRIWRLGSVGTKDDQYSWMLPTVSLLRKTPASLIHECLGHKQDGEQLLCKPIETKALAAGTGAVSSDAPF